MLEIVLSTLELSWIRKAAGSGMTAPHGTTSTQLTMDWIAVKQKSSSNPTVSGTTGEPVYIRTASSAERQLWSQQRINGWAQVTQA